MGVDLGGIMERRNVALDDLKGRRVAIDAYNTLYQFLTTIRQPDGTPLMDSKRRVTSHLSGLFYRTCNLLEKGILPCYVFDGKPSELKRKTLEEREERKREAEKAVKAALDAGRIEEAAMLSQRTVRMNKEMAEESRKLLELMGVPCIQAPSEGEAQCAWMAANGASDAVASQDYDSLLFGAPLLVRNVTMAGKRKIPSRNIYVDISPEEIALQENLDRLGVDRRKLIWIALLSGTDFNNGVYGIGPKKGLKLAQQCNSFDEIKAKLGDKAEAFDYAPVEELFFNPPHADVARDELRQGECRREELVALMVDEHEFSRDRVESSIAKAYKEPLDSKQSNLKKWF